MALGIRSQASRSSESGGQRIRQRIRRPKVRIDGSPLKAVAESGTDLEQMQSQLTHHLPQPSISAPRFAEAFEAPLPYHNEVPPAAARAYHRLQDLLLTDSVLQSAPAFAKEWFKQAMEYSAMGGKLARCAAVTEALTVLNGRVRFHVMRLMSGTIVPAGLRARYN